jgi:hypothetical protein
MDKTTSDACVSWIEGRVPDTEEACIVHELIIARGVRTRCALVQALAQELFERDCRRVGYMADMGIFRAWYEAGAGLVLDTLDGRTILIETVM